MISTRRCLICNAKNDTLHWHKDEDSGNVWCWCCKCDVGRSIWRYCYEANLNLRDFLSHDFEFVESKPNEVNKMEWPRTFVPLSDLRAKDGVEYIKSRGLSPTGDMYYDIVEKGIVFPYYVDNVFCGAQVRFIQERIIDDNTWKITTLPGTRLGLVIYGYNQTNIMPHVKGFIVTEGAFNALSIQQSLDKVYGGTYKSPWKAVACSGSGASEHQLSIFKELKERGYKIVCAPDNDKAGLKMFDKYVANSALTHFALTDGALDWNDELKKMGPKLLAKYFLDRIKKI